VTSLGNKRAVPFLSFFHVRAPFTLEGFQVDNLISLAPLLATIDQGASLHVEECQFSNLFAQLIQVNGGSFWVRKSLFSFCATTDTLFSASRRAQFSVRYSLMSV
jgi:hypothetical protein